MRELLINALESNSGKSTEKPLKASLKLKRYTVLRDGVMMLTTNSMAKVAELCECHVGVVSTFVTYKKLNRFEINGYQVHVKR